MELMVRFQIHFPNVFRLISYSNILSICGYYGIFQGAIRVVQL